MRVIRLLVATPLVALLGVAMALAAWPDGDVTVREREVVARLTRSGAQRLDADGGGHWTADAVDLADTTTPASAPASHAGLASTGAIVLSAPMHVTMLDTPAVQRHRGRIVAPPGRDRAPPRR